MDVRAPSGRFHITSISEGISPTQQETDGKHTLFLAELTSRGWVEARPGDPKTVWIHADFPDHALSVSKSEYSTYASDYYKGIGGAKDSFFNTAYYGSAKDAMDAVYSYLTALDANPFDWEM